MNKPYTICHMMTSVDGRIDCKMTEQLKGVEHYYSCLEKLNTPTHVSGRITAEKEMSLPGKFLSKTKTIIGKEDYYKTIETKGYEVVLDTKGTLLYNDQENEDYPILVLTSEEVSQEYLDYLRKQNISWIACGKERIDLKRACEILFDKFDVKRMAVVGGGHINASFLEEGLLDEISILIGAGIDGRSNMTAVFDGLPIDRDVTPLKLESVDKFNDNSIWIRYKVDR